MAISSNKFVNVSSTILTETAVARDFSGLVISKGTPLDATTGKGLDYTNGKIVVVGASNLGSLFAENSPEYLWGVKYFSYVSPSGTTPARLKFMKRKTDVTAAASATATWTGTGITAVNVTAATLASKLAVAASATPSVNPGAGVTAVTVDAATFSVQVSGLGGNYVFTCTAAGDTPTWTLNGTSVDLEDYGITTTGTPVVGDKITIVFVAGQEAADGTYLFTYATVGSVNTWTYEGKAITISDYLGTSPVTGTPALGDAISVAFKAATTAGDESLLKAFRRAIDDEETFGTFTFLSGTSTGESSAALLRAAADYNVTLNNDYRMVVDYSQTAGASNVYTNYVSTGTIANNLYGLKGLTLCDSCSYLTMARLAATDYTGTNTTGTDMFKTASGVSATVTSDSVYETLTNLRLNFIGLVKEHGNQWSWYMRGFNMDGTDSAVYDNEMWFKSEIVKDLLELEGTVEKIPANEQGLSMVSVTIQSSIDMALTNGTILPNKPISESKQIQILQKLGGSSELLSNLMENGYVLVLELAVDGEEYMIKYQVAYLKGDAVRYIEGTHTVA